jgi:hypothetical protein
VEIVQIVQRQGLAVIFHVVRFSLQEPVVCGLVAGLRLHANQLLLRVPFCNQAYCVTGNLVTGIYPEIFVHYSSHNFHFHYS